MTVLAIIGVLVAIVLLVLFVNYANEYSDREFHYEIFNITTFSIIAIGYVFIYFGEGSYNSALMHEGDLLNGILLMIIGAFLVIVGVFINIINTNLKFGIAMSVVQLILYAPLAVVAVFTLIMMVAALMQTKPVYNLND